MIHARQFLGRWHLLVDKSGRLVSYMMLSFSPVCSNLVYQCCLFFCRDHIALAPEVPEFLCVAPRQRGRDPRHRPLGHMALAQHLGDRYICWIMLDIVKLDINL